MRASVGDRLVVAAGVVDGAVRDGTVVELRHPDGSPPFIVEWSDTKERSLVFPGPDAHVERAVGEPTNQAAVAAGDPAPVRRWQITVTVTHEGPETTAQAVLVAGDPQLTGAVGHARKNPDDPSTPLVGEEVAVARALRQLADRLIETAEDAIEDATGRPARLH